MTGERWTVLRVLEWTQKYLRKGGIPSPRLESELLLSHVLGCDRIGLYLNHDMVLSKDELTRFRGTIERRISGEPTAYILGFQEFWSIRFKVDSHVLVPRPETEILVEEALRLIDQEGWREPRIAEVGTGCGAIAISIAKSVPSTKILATEVSWEAALLAKENAKVQNVDSRICIVQGDLLAFVKSGDEGTFDLMVSNPPYIRRADIETLQREIRDFEPREALDGGIDGLDFHRKLVHEASLCLRKGGWLILEIGADQDQQVLHLLEGSGEFRHMRIASDYAGKRRAMIAQKSTA